MLRYKTKTRPDLVALYDIRPGNGAGPFLQPRSPHGATEEVRGVGILWRLPTYSLLNIIIIINVIIIIIK